MDYLRFCVPNESCQEMKLLLGTNDINFVDTGSPHAPETIFASGGEIIDIVISGIPWASLATVCVAWINRNSKRKLIVTTKDYKVIHLEGMSNAEMEAILQTATRLTAIDPKKTKAK
jgi:hypothetical protein